MNLKNLQNLRYSNFLFRVTVNMHHNYSTVSFITVQNSLNSTPSLVTVTNRDGSFKKFHSLATLHRFLNEVFTWEIHPDLKHLDQMITKPEILVL